MKFNRFILTMLLIASGLLLTFAPKTPSASADELWRVPVDAPILAREFVQPSEDWSAGHRGVDYLVEAGQPVFATHDGVVSFVGHVVNRSVITLKHENGFLSSIEPICSSLRVGQAVTTGELLGFTCFGPNYPSHCGLQLCLHFSLRSQNGYLSPLVKIGGLSPSRLKPWGGLTCSRLSNVQC